MSTRTNDLARRAISAWPKLFVSRVQIDAANHLEMIELASRRDVGKVEMNSEARGLFDLLRTRILELGTDIIELADHKSVSYHSLGFFVEVVPRRYKLALVLPLEFSEIDDPSGLAEDATQWQFIANAQHEGGVFFAINDAASIESAMPIISKARAASGEGASSFAAVGSDADLK
jgi:predicted transport protein